MNRALALAARARGRTAPNPSVGAVVVSEGQEVGAGWTAPVGQSHAEVFALRQAGALSRGATLYVTLEPCCHYGRTPPCTDAIIAAGIRRVVAAMRDPHPRVNGGGFAQLRAAGVEVECGVGEAEAQELIRGFIKAVMVGLPWLTLKMAVTLDGKSATRTGDSRWVTGEAARRYVHRLRDWNDAVLIGIGTARADDPALTARLPRGRNPLRVVVDAHAELSPESTLARTAREIPTLLATHAGADARALEALGVEALPLPGQVGTAGRERVDLEALLRELAARGVQTVLCEGGAALAGALLDADLVDEVAWFIAPKLAGGAVALGAVAGEGVARMADAHPLLRMRTRRFGEDVGIFGYLHEPGRTPDQAAKEE